MKPYAINALLGKNNCFELDKDFDINLIQYYTERKKDFREGKTTEKIYYSDVKKTRPIQKRIYEDITDDKGNLIEVQVVFYWAYVKEYVQEGESIWDEQNTKTIHRQFVEYYNGFPNYGKGEKELYNRRQEVFNHVTSEAKQMEGGTQFIELFSTLFLAEINEFLTTGNRERLSNAIENTENPTMQYMLKLPSANTKLFPTIKDYIKYYFA